MSGDMEVAQEVIGGIGVTYRTYKNYPGHIEVEFRDVDPVSGEEEITRYDFNKEDVAQMAKLIEENV